MTFYINCIKEKPKFKQTEIVFKENNNTDNETENSKLLRKIENEFNTIKGYKYTKIKEINSPMVIDIKGYNVEIVFDDKKMNTKNFGEVIQMWKEIGELNGDLRIKK